MINVENTQACFVQLWLRLERTRQLLRGQYRRFCVRNVLRSWFGSEATDERIYEVCRRASLSLGDDTDDEPLYGYDELPLPSRYPRRHRELLRAIVSVWLDIGMRKVNLHALDAAYLTAFPHSTPIRLEKKKPPP